MDESKSISGNVGKWLAVVSAALTIGLTAINGYWSAKVSETESEIKKEAAELQKRRLDLDSDKERIARYTFVQTLLKGVLTQDEAQKNLTVNLINLALNDDEAKQLFSGLQASSNNETQLIGSLGKEVLAVSNLVLQMNDDIKKNRLEAVNKLLKNYLDDPDTVNQALSLFEPPRLNLLTASGRINVLVFLSNTELSAWTTQSISRAEKAVNQIRLRSKDGVAIGSQTENALSRFSEHLKEIKAKL
tara:strand:- start:10437 stop:11174 length:738 start_codon:yes stop_codon:yes gene_type:complete